METYEEIVSRWYSELHDPFVNLIKSRFNGLFFDEIEDIYQETFLAVHENLHRGSIEADTNWRAYIMRIGLNQTMTYCKAKGKFVTASQAGGDDDDVRPDWLSEMAPLETQVDESTDDPKERERMIAVMNGIMGSLTGKCRDLLPSFYYARMSMEEICQELGYANTDSAKSQRLKCFNKLKEAVRARLKMMGLL
ncbi:MAG: sigma-70 family RNA polymerase sigma factor [Muribaculaceae bacterium]|nr:sigma-70 family RNA polymerase sigma factor [Muribaculaceae bacterium]